MAEYEVKDSGKRIEFKSGMVRDIDDNKICYSLIPVEMIKAIGTHLTKGANKYGRENWRLANSEKEMQRFKDSAFRHFIQWINGETDEDHKSACAFNMWACDITKQKIKGEQYVDRENNKHRLIR